MGDDARTSYFNQASASLNTHIPFTSPLHSFGVDGQPSYSFSPSAHATSINEPLIKQSPQIDTTPAPPEILQNPPSPSPVALNYHEPAQTQSPPQPDPVADKFASLSINPPTTSQPSLQSSTNMESVPLASPDLNSINMEEIGNSQTFSEPVPVAVPAVQETYTVAKNQPVLLSSSKIPNDKGVASKTHLPFGMIYTPALELSPPAPVLELGLNQSPLRCTSCGAYINRYCNIDRAYDSWVCSLCSHKNSCRNSYSLNGSYPELVKHVYEYVQTEELQGSNVETRPTFMFVIDSNITQTDAQGIRESILATIPSLPVNAKIGICTFARVVNVYTLTHVAPVSADAYSGSTLLEPADVQRIDQKKDEYVVGVDYARKHLSSVLHCIVSSAAPDVKRHAKGRNTNNRNTNNRKTTSPDPRRATGAAIDVALALCSERGAIDTAGGQIILFTNGGPSYGPGAMPLHDTELEATHQLEHAQACFQSLGQRTAQQNVCVTFLCGGAARFHAPSLHSAALPNGGSLLLLKDFTGAALHTNLQLITTRCIGRNGVFDIRTSESVQLTRIIGPSAPLPKFDPSGEIPVEGTNTCYMAAVVPTQSFSIFYEPAEDIVADYVYFQFVSRWTTPDNRRVVRVVTRRVGTTGNIKTFLSSLDLDVSFVLLSKRLVLSARKGLDSDDVTRELDKSFKDILQAFGERSKKTHRYEFNTEILHNLPRKLFSTRRGPLLGPILQHKDDIDQVRCLFLNANFDDSLRMVDPKMFEIQTGEWIEVPLTTLALQSKNIVYVDHHTHILIWSGQDAAGPQFDHIRDMAVKEAHSSAASRFPQPQVMLFNEGSSMSRFLLCRLGPDHKDEMNDQIAIYPGLSRLQPAERSALLAKFHYTDDPSFTQYFRLLTSSI